jgi:hypothetical protein
MRSFRRAQVRGLCATSGDADPDRLRLMLYTVPLIFDSSSRCLTPAPSPPSWPKGPLGGGRDRDAGAGVVEQG